MTAYFIAYGGRLYPHSYGAHAEAESQAALFSDAEIITVSSSASHWHASEGEGSGNGLRLISADIDQSPLAVARLLFAAMLARGAE